MSKADVLSLVDRISNSQADSATAERYYRDFIYDLGELPVMVDVTFIPLGDGTAAPPGRSYALPDNVIKPLQWYYDDAQLQETTARERDQWDDEWGLSMGTPLAIKYDDDTSLRRFEPFPAPTHPSKPYIFIHGAPFGVDYPPYCIALFHTQVVEDLPVWFELPAALSVAAREFLHESAHRDPKFAQVCDQMAKDFLGLIV